MPLLIRRVAYFLLVGVLCFAGGYLRRDYLLAKEARKARETVEKAAKAAERKIRHERKQQRLAYPTLVREISDTSRLMAAPYPAGLTKVRCRGLEADFEKEFFAVFQCKKNGRATVAGALRRGMRLRLRVVPFEEAPAEVKGLAVADDVDDFTLPVYWVNGFEHAEAGLRVAEDPGRLQFANRLPHSVVKIQTEKVPAGEERPPFYFYGGDWGVYAPGAEETLVQETPGRVRSAVRSFHRLLQAKGIRLIFVPVPQSASLYPDVGLGGFEGKVLQREPANGAVGVLLKALQADGVTVCDLTEHFRNHRLYEHEGRSYPAWISNDTHWSSWASAEAARVVAEMILKEKVLDTTASPRLPSESFPVVWHPLQYWGDVATVEAARSLGVSIPPVPAMELRVKPARPEAVAILAPAPDTAPVHVLGDSFLGIWEENHAGFRAHMVQHLGVPVHAVTVYGSGNRGAPHTWWKASRDSAPKVVVWICAERMLPEPQWYGDGEME